MKLRSTRIALVCLVLSLWLCLSPAFARESYTITKAQITTLSENLQVLNGLITSLRTKLSNYKRELRVIAEELAASQKQLVKAENESNTFMLTLKKQETTLTEQLKSLQNAKTSLKRLKRRNKAKDILFALIIGGLITIKR